MLSGLPPELIDAIIDAVLAAEKIAPLYRYVAVTDNKLCHVCGDFDGEPMTPALAEATFDHLYKYNDEFWLPRTHMDLWNRDTCRCSLLAEGVSPEMVLQQILRRPLEGLSPFQLRMHALALSSVREVRKIVAREKRLGRW